MSQEGHAILQIYKDKGGTWARLLQNNHPSRNYAVEEKVCFYFYSLNH